MRIAAICPTFRRPRLIPGIVEMFQRQTHHEKVLLILDDGGSFETQQGENWTLYAKNSRAETVWHKFNWLISAAELEGADAIALMEDDDCYLPGYLEAHAKALEASPWSAASQVWFREPNKQPRLVNAERRFHGGWAYTLDAIREVGGYPTKPYGSDSGLESRLRDKFGPPADPWPDSPPQYVYRWQTSGYQNAHGFGQNMHAAMESSHNPERMPGPITPGLDAYQALHLSEVDAVQLASPI